MKDVNVTTLRQNLPDYLAQVEQGETLRVTLRGRVIAEITPPAPDSDQSDAARARLRGSLLRYDAPFEPMIAPDEWEMNRDIKRDTNQ
ncbi:MAG: type II toxin-antitoxin system prevent-host-death family antitoxin [Sterolibacteriaceae bacterium]|nr:type II toxin-antitoxin system prevent-host-death family antitoxin [Sterolibacteriaceae bacterium]MBK9084562.1 type II toxin-antitoxin system prevent-host-death family antitoxin [Sterolibacteriaceae bacterium]